MIMFLELPASLYRKFDSPKAVSMAHIKHKSAATMTRGIDAMKPPTLPARTDKFWSVDWEEDSDDPKIIRT